MYLAFISIWLSLTFVIGKFDCNKGCVLFQFLRFFYGRTGYGTASVGCTGVLVRHGSAVRPYLYGVCCRYLCLKPGSNGLITEWKSTAGCLRNLCSTVSSSKLCRRAESRTSRTAFLFRCLL